MDSKQDLKDRLIVALDVEDRGAAETLVQQLGDSITFYKVGYQLVFGGGLGLVADLLAEGKKVFLDMKLLDIDNTVEKGVANIAEMGVHMTTIHAYPKAMQAAVKAAAGSNLTLLGVTVLTSMDNEDLQQAGYSDDAGQLVLKRAQQARDAGMGGVVASAHEAETIRNLVGPEMAIVTPGIRPAGSVVGDQKRVMTPGKALAAGASHLVVGRPISAADNPVEAANAVLRDMASGA